MKRPIIILVSVIVLLLIAMVAWVRLKRFNIDALVSNLLDTPPATADQLDSIARIARDDSDYATQQLLSIAETDADRAHPSLLNETRALAIKKLHGRQATDIDQSLAHLLQPHEPLIIRQAAADELTSRKCDERCAADILHYLERVNKGEEMLESRIAGGDAFLGPQQEKLNSELWAILRHNESSTLSALEKIYGLGSIIPANFALVSLRTMQMRSGCSLLLNSIKAQQQFDIVPDRNLTDLLQVLNC